MENDFYKRSSLLEDLFYYILNKSYQNMLDLNSIYESLLDDEGAIIDSTEKVLVKKWLEDNVSGQYKVRVSKNNTINITGNILLKNYEGETLPEILTISSMKGNLSIEKCPNLSNIQNLFTIYAQLEGNLSINNCPKLTSLEGCPEWVNGSVSIMGNSSLRSLEGMPKYIFNNLYVFKNGKKFKKQDIEKIVTDKYVRIYCSLEDEMDLVNEQLINEAVNEPHLVVLIKQLKQDKTLIGDFQSILHYQLPWDNIDSSHVTEFEADKKAKTYVRKLISARQPSGITYICLLNREGQYTHIIYPASNYILCIDPDCEEWDYINDLHKGYWLAKSSTDLMKIVDKAFTIVTIEVPLSEISDMRRKQDNRKESRVGMILNTPEQNDAIARENMERYKKLANQKRASRDPEIEQIDENMEKLLIATMKLTRMAKANPQKFSQYDVTYFLQKIGDRKHWVKGKDVGSQGIFEIYSYIQSYYLSAVSGNSNNYEIERLKSYKEEFKSKYESLKKTLSNDFGISI